MSRPIPARYPAMRLLACFALLLFSLVPCIASAEDWIGFRGGQRYGVSPATNLPVEWDDQKNIAWKTDLPGLGTSSPTILGDRVYLTCYSGYGEDAAEPGEQVNLVRRVVCLDKTSGSILWEKPFPAKLPESEYQPGNNARHGYASSTIDTDGERLYVFFGASGMYCLDLEGNQLWHKDLGSGTHGWGSATSPVVVGDVVVVNASIESETLYGLNKLTGEEVWRAGGVSMCWASPVLVEAGGRTEVVLNVPLRATAYDPATGEELWYCDGCDDKYLCPSAIAHDGVVYLLGARRNCALAVRAGGSGDVTQSHVLWRIEKGANVTSPVYLDGRLYWQNEKSGVAYCVDAETGDVVYEERIRPRPGLIYASVTAADGKLYAASQENGAYVIEATPDGLNILAVNKFASDASRTNACFAISENRLYLRTDQAIYCIASE